MDFHELIYDTEEILDYYRRLYAVEYGILYSLRQICIINCEIGKAERNMSQLSFESFVLFFMTREQMILHERGSF